MDRNQHKATLQGLVQGHEAERREGLHRRIKSCLPNRKTVKPSVAKYVQSRPHTNRIESLWAMLKRAHKRTVHRLSAIRERDTTN